MQTLSRMVLLAVLAITSLAIPTNGFAEGEGATAIRQLMMATFDKPEAPLTVEPITVYRDLAVAGWAQGDGGGRALLRKKHDGWVLTLCSGDALREAKSLQHFGLSAEEAAAMAKAVTEAEANIDPKLVSKFSTFDGVVRMGDDGSHPPVDAHGKGHSQ